MNTIYNQNSVPVLGYHFIYVNKFVTEEKLSIKIYSLPQRICILISFQNNSKLSQDLNIAHISVI
jgi:hypothetical protein